MNTLNCISPIDGRYKNKVEELQRFFSEKALFSYRIKVESEYLIALSEAINSYGKMKLFSQDEKEILKKLHNISLEDAQMIKDIETKGFQEGNVLINATNHDVKAVEYFMKNKLSKTSLKDVLEFIHFALTSEDINNLAYALMLKDGVEKVLIPQIEEIIIIVESFASKYNTTPMLSRTHGQPASPTTVGKEFYVFCSRLERQLAQLRDFTLRGKLNGAVGNYNAHHAAFPNINWIAFSEKFITSLGLEANLITTQIENHDTYAELFDIIKRINIILINLNQDIWRYISDGWIMQKIVYSEVGSSTMPHKVNPIDFENSEGNLGLANALFEHFCRKLPVSRLQRDLSDSTVERNFGVAFAHCLLAYTSLLKGLSKIDVNGTEIIRVLENHPEVIAEAIQTILRREGADMPYEKLKELTRGKKVTLDELREFISQLTIAESVKEELLNITPLNYVGMQLTK